MGRPGWKGRAGWGGKDRTGAGGGEQVKISETNRDTANGGKGSSVEGVAETRLKF